jgi:magnesium-transporting ATPase (P-type)
MNSHLQPREKNVGPVLTGRVRVEPKLLQMTAENTTWHALSVEEVLSRQQTTAAGLGDEEAARRLAVTGPNRLPPPKRRSPLIRFLLQFHNVLIYVLLAAALITLLMAHWLDAGVILGVVVINAIIGFIQEGRAERALDAIRELLSQQCTVVRNGRPRTVPADELVPGDMVLVQSGDRVPADLRLLRQKNLRIDESMLTGESMPVEKSVEPVATSTILVERGCMAWSGTFVRFGQGTGVVVATGTDTEIGRISEMLGQVQTLLTPLLRQMAVFANRLTVTVLVLAVVIFTFGILVRDYSVTEMFMAATGIAIAAIPEELPALMTIMLAIGVQRMARRNAIIRRLPAVETLGSVTVICTDKTGTLTLNEMMVQSLITADRLVEITGEGYTPRGTFTAEGKLLDVTDDAELRELGRASILCNDAVLEKRDGNWKLEGDPTEGALVAAGLKAGIDPEQERKNYPRVDVIPFESEHRFMATLHHDHAGHSFVYLKGAPEIVLGKCDHVRSGGTDRPIDRDYWHRLIELIANRGQRPLAIAVKHIPHVKNVLTFKDAGGGFILLGVFGISDPLRPEAVAAVTQCREAGIRVLMITGDHVLTARAIGAQLQLGHGQDAVISGADIDRMDDEKLATALKATDIVARASPEHKLRLVKVLQAQGQVVAMTGDGVNDAPALKRADIGIAMGRKGTEVAREAARMVLADDNFASIVRAIEEGRTVYANLKKSILYILPTNGGEAMLVISAVLIGLPLPITALQILWINMVTTVALSLALAFEPGEVSFMQQPPRKPDEPILSQLILWRILFVTLIVLIGTFGLFLWMLERGADINYARTVAVNTLAMFEIFYLLNTRYISAPVWRIKDFIGNRVVLIAIVVVIVLQVLFTYTAPMQALFATEALDRVAWLHIIPVAFSVFVLVEIEKLLIRVNM